MFLVMANESFILQLQSIQKSPQELEKGIMLIIMLNYGIWLKGA